MRLLDRYILKSFLVPFLLCLFGFLAIWLVFDLADNGRDFMDAKAGVGFIFHFYLLQAPQVAMLCLPVGLLLSLLYCLSRMSRSNEVISMLTAGQSLGRILLPLVLVGVLLTGVATVLNYKLAPQSERIKKEIFDQLGRKKRKDSRLESQFFKNRVADRTWFVQKMPANPPDDARLSGLHIIQQDSDGNIVTKWYAREGRFLSPQEGWLLRRGKTVQFDREGNILSDDDWDELRLPDWNETPWRIASTQMDSQSLSVPELRKYLRYNADFPDTQLAPYRTHLFYRWALPWSCLVVVLLAAPLGIVYSRRGVLAGVAGAIFLFAANLFLNYFLLALGKGLRVPPIVAAWGSNLLFAVVGLYLLHLRNANRELPQLRRWFKAH